MANDENGKPVKPTIPEIVKNPPDLSDWIGRAENSNWDRANIEKAQNNDKNWGHSGIPPEQPIDKSE